MQNSVSTYALRSRVPGVEMISLITPYWLQDSRRAHCWRVCTEKMSQVVTVLMADQCCRTTVIMNEQLS